MLWSAAHSRMRRTTSTRFPAAIARFSPPGGGRGACAVRPRRARGSVLAFYLLATLVSLFVAARSAAQPAERQRVSIVIPADAPAGFDEKRLVERVRVYLDSMGVDATSTRLPAQDAVRPRGRFVLELRWPEAKMTPLEGVVLDTSTRPAKRYSFDIGFAQSWPEFERLVALKLRSVLRVAVTEQAELPPEHPSTADTGTATVRQPEAGPRQRARFMFELGGAAVISDAADSLQAAGATRLAVGLGDWSFGVASTFALPPADRRIAGARDVVETSLTASLRYDLLSLEKTRAALQLGAEAGVFVARVAAEQAAEERIAYALSPVVSALVLGGYRLGSSGSVAVLGGPSVDFLLTRSEVTVGGVSLYDSGRFRYGLQLKLIFAF